MNEAEEIAFIAKEMGDRLGPQSGLGGTLKFDFKGKGCVYLDGRASPNTVSTDDKTADCTITLSLDTFKKMVAREIDGTTAFMRGDLQVAGDMALAMKLGPILEKAAG